MLPPFLLVLASLNLYVIDGAADLKGCEMLIEEYRQLNPKVQLLCINKNAHRHIIKRILKDSKK